MILKALKTYILPFLIFVTLDSRANNCKNVFLNAKWYEQNITFNLVSNHYGATYKFTRPSEKQFSYLKNEFGGQSQVRYLENKDYYLEDFLPPVMQALIGRELKTHKEKIDFPLDPMRPEAGVTIYTTSNCYSTVYNLIQFSINKFKSTFDLFWYNRDKMEYILSDSRLFNSIPVQEIKFGDSILYYAIADQNKNLEVMMHASIALGHGLVFEKPDTGESAWRLQLLSDSIRTVSSDSEYLFGSQSNHIENRAFRVKKNAILPDIRRNLISNLDPKLAKKISELTEIDNLLLVNEEGIAGSARPGLYRFQSINIRVDSKSGRGLSDIENSPEAPSLNPKKK